ncbi:MAG: helix-turn-helix domain-containing protein [Flavisolibacter sp.]
MKKIPPQLSKEDNEALELLRDRILLNVAEDYSIPALVKKTGLNRDKLTWGFKNLFGQTVHQFLIEARMHHAYKLLRAGEKSLKFIASEAGYGSTQNFSTAFKKYFGFTPTSVNTNAALPQISNNKMQKTNKFNL